MFRFKIEIDANGDAPLALTFIQTFTSITEEGNLFVKRHEGVDFEERLKGLEKFMKSYLEDMRKRSSR
jgi:hypothetical protein